MRSQLQQRFEVLEVSEPEWRVAWRVPAPRFPILAAPLSAALLLGLLLIDGTDWLETITELLGCLARLPSLINLNVIIDGDSVSAQFFPPDRALQDAVQDGLEATVATGLYAFRHSLLYLALSRWAFEWDRRWYNEAGES